MHKKTISSVLFLLLINAFVLSSTIRLVHAGGAVYIRADGSIDPPTAPVQREGDAYTLTGDLNSGGAHGLVVERSNMTFNGAGFSIVGEPSWLRNNAIILSQVTNATIVNVTAHWFADGVFLSNCSNCSILACNISTSAPESSSSGPGIKIDSSSYINITGNTCNGILLLSSSNSTLLKNIIYGRASRGVFPALIVSSSTFNRMIQNTLHACLGDEEAVVATFSLSSSNMIYHNNFLSPYGLGIIYCDSFPNVWDNGYPSGGNYHFGYYAGIDMYGGPFQNETGSDGLGDVPCLVGPNNRDNYPLMRPYYDFDVAVNSIHPQDNVVPSGALTTISVAVENQGQYSTGFNLTLSGTYFYPALTRKHNLVAVMDQGWNYSTPGPSLVAVEGDTMDLALVGMDTLHHKFYVDYNGNSFPDTIEPQTADFMQTTVPLRFLADTVGNFTYYCAYHQNTEFGSFTVEAAPSGTFELGSQNITLDPDEQRTVTFDWNTTGFLIGNYRISAYAEPVPEELDTADNTYTDGMVALVGQDTVPPNIETVARTPTQPDYDRDVLVSAVITDASAVNETWLSYARFSLWQNVSMSRTFGDSYEGVIPALPHGTTVQYKIYTCDTNRNWAESSVYSYTVGDSVSPEISRIEWRPACPFPYVTSNSTRANEPTVVTANISEPVDASGMAAVLFSYRVDWGKWWNTTVDYNSTSGLWETTIPAQSNTTNTVEFVIEARDKAGNAATFVQGFSITPVLAGDINADGKIDMKDISFAARHFGDHYP